MKADRIIKNAKIFTSNKDMPQAAALAVKDGKFVYICLLLQGRVRCSAVEERACGRTLGTVQPCGGYLSYRKGIR